MAIKRNNDQSWGPMAAGPNLWPPEHVALVELRDRARCCRRVLYRDGLYMIHKFTLYDELKF